MGEPNRTKRNYSRIWRYALVLDVDWLDAIVEVTSSSGFGNGLSLTGPFNGTLIANSKLNEYFGRVQRNTELSEHGPVIRFKITQDILNEMPMNVTMSTITAYGFWNTTVNATIDSFINVYRFSRPLNLIVPYSASLLVALSFIVLGLWALYQNGVPATDGGFIQLITTSTGSRNLQNAAAGGCLGASENAPPSLKKLRVRYAMSEELHWSSMMRDVKVEDWLAWQLEYFKLRWKLPDKRLFLAKELATGKVVGFTVLSFPGIWTEEQVKASSGVPPLPEGINEEWMKEKAVMVGIAKKYGYDPATHYHRKGIVVLPEYQRRGIASKLSQRLNEIVDEEGGRTYVIAVPASMPMFKMQGFEIIGTESMDMAKFGGPPEQGKHYVMLRKPHSKVTANS
ncbi:hypothetical protein IFR04_003768 [Cadophora malorum]|uniref:N-acetyltransferase domain-containing protein n=1 Tax=Cadophora malorum TaxID=108018 RepID=A0A8H7WE03_9HELO|nr:hypothetical protein IFR04_003768 [Cadophora malorum]